MREAAKSEQQPSNAVRLERMRSTTCVDTHSGISLARLSDSDEMRSKVGEWYNDPGVYREYLQLRNPPNDKFIEVEFRHAVSDPITASFEIQHPSYGSIGLAQAHSIDWHMNGCTYGAFIGDPQYRGMGIGTTVRALMFSLLQRSGFETVRFDIFSRNIASLRSLLKFNPKEIAARNPGERSFLLDLSSWHPPEWIDLEVKWSVS